jgi:hypothetical protein
MTNLHDSLSGWTVLRSTPGDGIRVLCYLEVTRGGDTKVVPMDIPGPKGPSRPRSWSKVYPHFETLLRDVVDYLGSFDTPPDRNPLVPVEDSSRFLLGFRCQETHSTWWASVTAVHKSRWMCVMSSPEGRARFCEALFVGGWDGYQWHNPMDRQSVLPEAENQGSDPL